METHRFDDSAVLWGQYIDCYRANWEGKVDARGELAAEVAVRLHQLHELLVLLEPEMLVVSGDPAENARRGAEFLAHWHRFSSGQISEEQYVAGLPPSRSVPFELTLRAFRRIRLFTESFYLIAWRLREILNATGSFAFPGIGKFDPVGIRNVRNHLIQHPELQRGGARFSQSLMIVDDGPVLKSSGATIDQSVGRVRADTESLDKGLYLNANEFGRLFDAKVRRALEDRLGPA